MATRWCTLQPLPSRCPPGSSHFEILSPVLAGKWWNPTSGDLYTIKLPKHLGFSPLQRLQWPPSQRLSKGRIPIVSWAQLTSLTGRSICFAPLGSATSIGKLPQAGLVWWIIFYIWPAAWFNKNHDCPWKTYCYVYTPTCLHDIQPA